MQQYTRPGPAFFYTLSIALCLLVGFNANAQFSIGIEGGYNKNYLVTNNANRAFTYYEPLSSFTIGIPVTYTVNDWLAVEADPGFIQKNYRLQRADYFTGVFEDNKNGYIQLPVMAHFMFGGNRLKGFLNAGLYGAYWLSANIKGTMPNILDLTTSTTTGTSVYNNEQPFSYSGKYTFSTVKDNRLEAGWVGGVGLQYDVTRRYTVFTEARLLYSFTDQQKNYSLNQVPRYNSTSGINAGVMMNLKNNYNKY